ncbi:cytochrome c biogenesis protein ResB [Paracoccus endophyticus]|uniref:cytochrome c biogenesis protein ResB n=1 Tax=Paracoccus endophyticus TaxID=2233774 RepID=UPI0013A6F589|nr:cytochrome c biogenesis protein ResB [Paracoccus endophyticus]
MEEKARGRSPQSFRPERISKVFAHRLLETNPVPILWTTTSIDSCDPAFLRRMSCSVEMRTPSEQVRKRIRQRLADRHQRVAETGALIALAGIRDRPRSMN